MGIHSCLDFFVHTDSFFYNHLCLYKNTKKQNSRIRFFRHSNAFKPVMDSSVFSFPKYTSQFFNHMLADDFYNPHNHSILQSIQNCCGTACPIHNMGRIRNIFELWNYGFKYSLMYSLTLNFDFAPL